MNLISGPGNIQSQIESIQNHDANILIADYRTRNDKKIIGVNDPYLKTDPTTLMQDVDFSTYGDRAIIKLTNSTGTTVEWRGACIVAKPIVQYSNANGYKWTYSDYADIERNGEKSATIGNDYIISSDQVESIGDYWSKELKPHNVYSLVYPGCLYHLQRGDVWHLTLSYTCPGGVSEAELIDTDVEIVGTEIKKSVGGIGETIIDCRVPSGAWSKTTSRRARLIGAGKADYLLNRSNTLTVAASTWTGQADLFCDGTADDVQIQAAIDRMYDKGGGEVVLTSGKFIVAATIIIKDNVLLHGSGAGTVIKPVDNSITTIVDWGSTVAIDAQISNLKFDGTGISGGASVVVIRGRGKASCSDILITGFDVGTLYAFYQCLNTISCKAYSNIPGDMYSFGGCVNVATCESANNTVSAQMVSFESCTNTVACISSNNSAQGNMVSFYLCDNVTSCTSSANTAPTYIFSFATCTRVVACNTSGNTTATNRYGFASCKSVQQCKSSGDTSAYGSGGYQSYADSGTGNVCQDTAAGGYNS